MTPSPLRTSDPQQLGAYRFLGRLGEGGMGSVYLAQGPGGRQVAVKVVKPELACDSDFRTRFHGEVKRARQVPPFCTAEVLDADTDHPTPYLVVEYVEGPNLAEVVQERGRLTGGALHSVAIGVATALVAIHDAGVVHRDLKPANVLFALGTPKVIDFGIAKALDTTSQHTVPGQILGTIAYMGPERFDTKTAADVGPSTDLFAWGAVVTYAATGHTPWTPEALIATAGGGVLPPPDLAGVPTPLRDLVARALHADPDQRPTAHELLELLLIAGAAGNSSIRAGLHQRPDLERAAAAVRHTVRHDPTAERTSRTPVYHRLGTLVQRRAWRTRWLPPGVVAAIIAAAMAAGFAINPIAALILRDTDTGAALQERRKADDDRTSRGSSRGKCLLNGPLKVTPQAPRFACPTSGMPAQQSVHARLLFGTPGACAAIWTHVHGTDSYQVTACTDHVSLSLIRDGRVRILAFTHLDETATTAWHDIEILTPAQGITVNFDADLVIRKARTPSPPEAGTVMLGIVPHPDRRSRSLTPDAHLTVADVAVTSTP